MCGIMGYVGKNDAKEVVLNGLRLLEYRGYDSAGIFVENKIYKKQGKLVNLESHIKNIKIPKSFFAIGHTRWATHGVPSDENAHPHEYNGVTLVHNGIIENYQLIKEYFLKKGHEFSSKTDTEVITHLLKEKLDLYQDPIESLLNMAEVLIGSYSLAIILKDYPQKIFFIKKSLPLIIGKGEGENFLSSDQAALVEQNCQIYKLQDGEFGVMSKNTIDIYNLKREKITPLYTPLTLTKENSKKNDFKYYMHKEIYEQPNVVKNLLNKSFDFNINDINKIYFIGCGSAYLAAMAVKDEWQSVLKIPCIAEVSSEFRYTNPVLDNNTLVIGISQSGETADTLAALEKALKEGARLLTICNTLGSAIASLGEASTGNLHLDAGQEIAVASTKGLMAQIVALKMLCSRLAGNKNIELLKTLPSLIEKALSKEEEIKLLAKKLLGHQRIIYIGRREMYALALEGALKMKELSYIFAEGYAAGELKHGHIATIDKSTPVIALFNDDNVLVKTLSNAEEVMAREGEIISLAPPNLSLDFALNLTYEAPPYLAPMVVLVYLQLLAYHVADLKGLDVDKPRNLAKSVTVE